MSNYLYSGGNVGGKTMTWSDPIVEEVRRVRDAYAARFNYDLRAIYRDLKEQEKRSGATLCRTPIETATASNDKGQRTHADQDHSGTK